MNALPLAIDRLRLLDFWPGPIEVEPLHGGITNRNYLVRSGRQALVARLSVERPLLGIDRRNEVLCQRAAFKRGVAPEVVHHEAGLLVSRFLPGRTLIPEDVRDPAILVRLAAALKTLHTREPTGIIRDFSAFQIVQTYATTARSLGAELPRDLDEILADSRSLADRLRPCVPVLCHNDLLAANVVVDDDHVWLVDWEYAGVGNPLFDLAGLAANNELDEAGEVALLTAYQGRFDRSDLRELHVLKTISLLREALWGLIQTVASEIDFDYGGYAERYFSAYRAARIRLDRVQT